MDQNNNNNRDPDSDEVSVTRDPKKLSFSQAQGYEDLPGQLKLGELPDQARTQIWNCLYLELKGSIEFSIIDGRDCVSGNWKGILEVMHCFFDNGALDDWSSDWDVNRKKLRNRIEHDQFNRVFDRLQFIMRCPGCPDSFISSLKDIFQICGLAYAIDKGPPPTILPAATEEEGTQLVQSLESLQQAGLKGSATHLRAAAQEINAGDWAGAIRESIHAVESVARQIDPNASNTLAPALKSLEQQGALHPALKGAFNKLYGYTSDEQGIRHALLEHESAKADVNEAVFMLGACASFASYLWRKHVAGAKS